MFCIGIYAYDHTESHLYFEKIGPLLNLEYYILSTVCKFMLQILDLTLNIWENCPLSGFYEFLLSALMFCIRSGLYAVSCKTVQVLDQ